MAFKLGFIFIALINGAFAMRVVSTSPAITEMIAQLGFEESIVGRTPYCQDATQAQSIGSALNPDYEKIIALKPDVVFLQENTKGEVSQKLTKLGIPFRSLKIVGLKDLFQSWRTIAEELKAGSQKINELENKIEKKKSTRKVLFVLGGTIGASVMVAGKDTFYDDLAHSLGFINVARTSGWPVYDTEKTRSIVDEQTLVFHFVTSEERLWSKEVWQRFCPRCKVHTSTDVRLTYPGPLMVEHFIDLTGKLK